MNEELGVRYGGGLPLNIDSDDVTATSATIYIGTPGQTAVITKTGAFASGSADVSLVPADTRVPLATYKLQTNITYADGSVKKFPDPTTCDGEFPDFIVAEALDETEVV